MNGYIRMAQAAVECPRCWSKPQEKCSSIKDKRRKLLNAIHIERRRALMKWKVSHQEEFDRLMRELW